MPRPYFNDRKPYIDEILRVDHAGEYGAIRIYEGQYKSINAEYKPVILDMMYHEKKHLEYFESEMLVNKTRPTIFMPLWHIGGYLMGYLSSIVGVKYAMLCTEAVEEVIDEHYKKQYNFIKKVGNLSLAEKIEEHRLDEVTHKDIAISHGSSSSKFYFEIKFVIMNLCKFAIFISKIA